MIKNCFICKKEFKTSHKKSKFCSVKCKAKFQKLYCWGKNHPRYNRIKKKCFVCKKEFTVEQSASHSKYCSQKCMGKHREVLYKGKNHPMYGKHHTEESKRKISLLNKGKPSPWKGKHPTGKTRELMRKNHANVKDSRNPNWKGGYCKLTNYILIHKPNHPCAVRGYVLEHRYIMEQELKRLLKRTEIIHHIDRDKTNNRLSNLMLFPNQAAHMYFHKKYFPTRRKYLFQHPSSLPWLL